MAKKKDITEAINNLMEMDNDISEIQDKATQTCIRRIQTILLALLGKE